MTLLFVNEARLQYASNFEALKERITITFH